MKYKIKILTISSIVTLSILVPINNIFADEGNTNNEVYINQLQEKNKLFKEALDNFGATSKEEAIRLYSEGVKQRSGPLQYSVMSDKLKLEFENKLEEDKNYSWVTGVSSPWVDKYQIIASSKIDKNTYLFTVKFFLNDTNGLFDKYEQTLKVKKYNGKWYISKIKNN